MSVKTYIVEVSHHGVHRINVYEDHIIRDIEKAIDLSDGEIYEQSDKSIKELREILLKE